MKISVAGKKLVVALGYNKIWDATTSTFVKLESMTGNNLVFINDQRSMKDLVDIEHARSIHLLDMDSPWALAGELDRLAPEGAKWFHSADRCNVPSGWQWGECPDHNGVISDLACLLHELPLGEKLSLVDALQQRMVAAMLNP